MSKMSKELWESSLQEIMNYDLQSMSNAEFGLKLKKILIDNQENINNDIKIQVKSKEKLKEINKKIKQFDLVADYIYLENERYEKENLNDFVITHNNIRFRTFDFDYFVLCSSGYYVNEIEKSFEIAKQLESVGLFKKENNE